MVLLILFVLLALSVSFVCSILESVLLSITPAYLSLLEQQEHPAAARLRSLKDKIDRPLAAILSLNTIANTVGATGAGAQAAQLLGSTWLGVFSAIFTLLVLTCSEIIPKTLGAVHWKRLTPFVVRVLPPLMLLLLPLVKVAEWLTRLLTPQDRGPAVSREEITAMAEEGQRVGVVEEGEMRVLRNLLRLSVLRVGDVMTPLEHMVTLPENAEIGEVVARVTECRFSRVPLHRNAEGHRRCSGYVLKDDVLELAAHDRHGASILDLRRELLAVPQDMPVPAVFDRMVERREHIALVLDREEMTGLVTMEDIIETLLGLEILDELDQERIHELARAHWQERARRRGRLPTEPAASTGVLGVTGGQPPARAGADPYEARRNPCSTMSSRRSPDE